jgi:hypothetical protein
VELPSRSGRAARRVGGRSGVLTLKTERWGAPPSLRSTEQMMMMMMTLRAVFFFVTGEAACSLVVAHKRILSSCQTASIHLPSQEGPSPCFLGGLSTEPSNVDGGSDTSIGGRGDQSRSTYKQSHT